MLAWSDIEQWISPADRAYFAGTAAVVTGGAQGIGRAIAYTLGAAGAVVAILDPDAEAVADFAQAFGTRGVLCSAVVGSVAEPSDVARLAHALGELGLPLRTLVNNAGIGSGGEIHTRPLEAWDHVLAVNLRGPYLLTARLLPFFGTHGGTIVNIASTRAIMSGANTEPYAASKGGVLALTHSLAISLAPRRIRVNCISPGWIVTGEWQKKSARRAPALSTVDHGQHPVGRVGIPEDIARACLFLAGSGAGFITGTNLVVDGGMTIKMIYVE